MRSDRLMIIIFVCWQISRRLMHTATRDAFDGVLAHALCAQLNGSMRQHRISEHISAKLLNGASFVWRRLLIKGTRRACACVHVFCVSKTNNHMDEEQLAQLYINDAANRSKTGICILIISRQRICVGILFYLFILKIN